MRGQGAARRGRERTGKAYNSTIAILKYFTTKTTDGAIDERALIIGHIISLYDDQNVVEWMAIVKKTVWASFLYIFLKNRRFESGLRYTICQGIFMMFPPVLYSNNNYYHLHEIKEKIELLKSAGSIIGIMRL